ncbi:MAG: heme a synthase [Solirubrobacteraceae bacterium]|jgi:cytochrome c oxidase assembly protein subunit 15|nr:heme a synthase [Solirubrobacteraceae bacterium]
MGRRLSITLTPRQYERIAQVALASLTLIVMTGAAVRLTRSGLGCPDWPRCYGRAYPPLNTNALIEFANRILSGFVGLAAIAAGALALRRRPYRRDLAVLGILLPLGVVAQAVLGGFTVRHHLAPGFVMAHFGLSMLILVAAASLAWRAGHEPRSRPRTDDRLVVWSVRLLAPLAAIAIFAGTAATAAGPHAGGSAGQVIRRLTFEGRDTLAWTIHAHGLIASVLGVAAVGVWALLRARGADPILRRSVTAVCLLLLAQGVVGGLQYLTHLPAEVVWVHVTLASLTWLTVLWAVAAAGRLTPRRSPSTEPAAALDRAAAAPRAPASA